MKRAIVMVEEVMDVGGPKGQDHAHYVTSIDILASCNYYVYIYNTAYPLYGLSSFVTSLRNSLSGSSNIT